MSPLEWIAIVLLVIVGAIVLAIFFVWLAYKISKSRNASTTYNVMDIPREPTHRW